MTVMKMELAALTEKAEEIARVQQERRRQLKIAQDRYRDSVEKRARERFKDPAEVERYLNE